MKVILFGKPTLEPSQPESASIQEIIGNDGEAEVTINTTGNDVINLCIVRFGSPMKRPYKVDLYSNDKRLVAVDKSSLEYFQVGTPAEDLTPGYYSFRYEITEVDAPAEEEIELPEE